MTVKWCSASAAASASAASLSLSASGTVDGMPVVTRTVTQAACWMSEPESESESESHVETYTQVGIPSDWPHVQLPVSRLPRPPHSSEVDQRKAIRMHRSRSVSPSHVPRPKPMASSHEGRRASPGWHSSDDYAFGSVCCPRTRRDAPREPKWQALKNLRARIAM